MRSASPAVNVGREWSERIRSGANRRNASRNAASEATRLVTQAMWARWSSRSISAASVATSSTRRMRTGPGIASARRLVEQQPVEPDLGDGAGERLEVDRLDDVAVRAQPVRGGDVGLLARGREDHHRKAARALVVLEAPQHLEPVHAGQLQVEQDHF